MRGTDSSIFNEEFSLKYNKIANTIKSCKTEEHADAAYKMIDNFTKMFYHANSYSKLGLAGSLEASFEFDRRIGELGRLLKRQCAEIHGANNTIGEELRSRLEPLITVLTLWKILNKSENKSLPGVDKKKVKEDFALAMANLDMSFEDLSDFGKYLDNYIFDPIKYENVRK